MPLNDEAQYFWTAMCLDIHLQTLKLIRYAEKINQTNTCLAWLEFQVLLMYSVI